ncbi:unnamed protein product [Urochloa humidicola]
MGCSTAALMAAAVSVTLLVSLAAVADWSNTSYDDETRRMFVEWKVKFGQTYKDAGEEEYRYALFKDSRRRRGNQIRPQPTELPHQRADPHGVPRARSPERDGGGIVRGGDPPDVLRVEG